MNDIHSGKLIDEAQLAWRIHSALTHRSYVSLLPSCDPLDFELNPASYLLWLNLRLERHIIKTGDHQAIVLPPNWLVLEDRAMS